MRVIRKIIFILFISSSISSITSQVSEKWSCKSKECLDKLMNILITSVQQLDDVYKTRMSRATSTVEPYGHYNILNNTKQNNCTQIELVNLLAKIRVISPESIVRLTTKYRPENLCRKLTLVLKSADDYLQTCDVPSTFSFYLQLFRGIKAAFDKLCTCEEFRKRYEEYFSCFNMLHNEYIECEGPADWIQFKDDHSVCSIRNKISDCFFIKNGILCGEKPANCMDELVNEVMVNAGPRSCKRRSLPKLVNKFPETKEEQLALINEAPTSAAANIQPLNLIICLISLFSIFV